MSFMDYILQMSWRDEDTVEIWTPNGMPITELVAILRKTADRFENGNAWQKPEKLD